MKTARAHKQAILTAVVSMARTLHAAPPPLDYAEASNWVLRPAAPLPFAADVFYVYPTLVSNPDQPLMDLGDHATRAKTRGVAQAQSGPFASFANVFAPFCRQVEYGRALEILRGGPSLAEAARHAAVADSDVAAAFDYYAKNLNPDRPFFLLGHSQGARNLLALLKRGFAEERACGRLVAAYLIGAAIHTNEAADLRGVKFARGADDFGALVSFNTQAPGAENPFFTGDGVYGINPLNWRVDAEPAAPSQNLGAVLYNWSDGTAREVAEFCGAVLDPATGAVLAEPSAPGKYDARALGRGVYHMNDIYFFFRNLEENARRRLAAFQRGGARQPEGAAR